MPGRRETLAAAFLASRVLSGSDSHQRWAAYTLADVALTVEDLPELAGE